MRRDERGGEREIEESVSTLQAGANESGELLQQVQGEEQLGVLRRVQLLLLRQGAFAGAFERESFSSSIVLVQVAETDQVLQPTMLEDERVRAVYVSLVQLRSV